MRTLDIRFQLDSAGAVRNVAALEGSLRGTEARLKSLGSTMQTTGRRMSSVGSSMTRGFTLPVIGGLALATKGWMEHLKVAAQSKSVIASTGAVAGVTAKHLDRMAGRLQRLTKLDDEAIQSGQNLLLTFTNVRNETGRGNDVFDQATRATLDMSVAMKTDLKSAALAVGKALNDPVRGITALRRQGVQFTEEQKEQIETLVKSGHRMKAQKLILAELNKEFGGSAKAAGDAEGEVGTLRVSLDELGESLGKSVMPFVKQGADLLTGWARSFQQLSPATQEATVKMVLLGAALGPVMKVLGNVTSAVGGLTTSLGFLIANPMAALVVAAGVGVGALALMTQPFDKVAAAADAAADATQRFKDSQEALKSAKDQLPGAKLNAKQSGLSLQQARQNLALLKSQGASTLQLAQGKLSVKMAEEGRAQALKHVNDLERTILSETRKGEAAQNTADKEHAAGRLARIEQLRGKLTAMGVSGSIAGKVASKSIIEGLQNGTIKVGEVRAALDGLPRNIAVAVSPYLTQATLMLTIQRGGAAGGAASGVLAGVSKKKPPPKPPPTVVGATGGIVRRPTLALIGEAGPEAVVPLNQTPGNSPLPSGGFPGRGGGGVTVIVRIDARNAVMREAALAQLVEEAGDRIAEKLNRIRSRRMAS